MSFRTVNARNLPISREQVRTSWLYFPHIIPKGKLFNLTHGVHANQAACSLTTSCLHKTPLGIVRSFSHGTRRSQKSVVRSIEWCGRAVYVSGRKWHQVIFSYCSLNSSIKCFCREGVCTQQLQNSLSSRWWERQHSIKVSDSQACGQGLGSGRSSVQTQTRFVERDESFFD